MMVSLAITPAQATAIQANYEAMVAHGLAPDYWDAAQVAQQTQSSAFLAALVEPDHGQLWPAKLVVGMARAAQHQGAQIYTHTPVHAVTRQGEGFSVTTGQGQIQTGAVVYATNALAHHLLPQLKGVIVPVRGQVVATAPAPRLFDFDWLANEGYEYAIQRQDGRIIFGGMRRKSPTQEIDIEDDSTLNPAVSRGLRTFLSDIFTPLKDVLIDYEWTGIMGFVADENPLVGKLSNRPGEYISAGYTGHGMALAVVAGRAIAEQIAGNITLPIPRPLRTERFG